MNGLTIEGSYNDREWLVFNIGGFSNSKFKIQDSKVGCGKRS